MDMEISNIKEVYFIGIGGIGMSALARFFNERGASVKGYDKVSTPLTKKMQEEGIEITFEDKIELLNQQADLVVYTPAIPQGHQQLSWYQSHSYPVCKRSEILQWITKNMFSITVAGTHGKTTVSTMIAHILRNSNFGCNAFLGGISNNNNRNYWSGTNNV